MNDSIGLAEHRRQSGAEAGTGIVITGIGVLTALGASMAELSAGLRSGTCGLQKDPELGKHLLGRDAPDPAPRELWAASHRTTWATHLVRPSPRTCPTGRVFAPAEHGIGQVLTEEMHLFKPAVELELMRAVKSAIDPQDLFNPGRLLPAPAAPR